MKSIAIEREFGSGGREIGQKLAKELEIPFYDSDIILKAAEGYGFNIDILREYDEKQTGSMLYNIALMSNANRYNEQSRVYEMFYGIRETIKKAALERPAVFIGRCSTDVLGKEDLGYKVFLYASDISHKQMRVMKSEGVEEQAAKKMIPRRDKQREQYFRFFTQKEWNDRNNYDLELNTSAHSVQECVSILAGIMRQRT